MYLCIVEYFRAKHLCDYNMIVHLSGGGLELLTTLSQHRDALDGKMSRPAFVWAALSAYPLSIIYFVTEVVRMGCAFKVLTMELSLPGQMSW